MVSVRLSDGFLFTVTVYAVDYLIAFVCACLLVWLIMTQCG